MSRQIHIAHYDHYTNFCRVSPHCDKYASVHPVYSFYDDGSWSRQLSGTPYYRSPAGKLKKPHNEYTLQELSDILEDNNKELAEEVYRDTLKKAKEQLAGMAEYQPYYLVSLLAKDDTYWKNVKETIDNYSKTQ